jgi:kynurenine 3-monooxygenase
MSTQLSPVPQPCRNVLIIGGGPAGFAAGLMLAKRGWTEITVVEQRVAADEYEPDKSFNYLIDGRGQKFTDLLGLTEQLAAIGVSNREFYLTRIQANGSRKTLKLPLIDPTRRPAYWLPRRAFVQLLYQEIQQHWSHAITVLFNTRCVDIHRVCTEGVETLEVTLDDRESLQQRRLKPRFLLGCDGLNSIVRVSLNTWEPSGRFEMQPFPSPSSGLRYKVLTLPPKFPLDAAGMEQSVPTMSYAIRSTFQDPSRSLSLGLLPVKDPDAPRTANLITRPNHSLWELKTPEAVLDFFDRAFPQIPLRHMVSREEIDRFAHSRGGTFPVPQVCSGLHYLSTVADRTEQPTVSGVVLLGDAVHCFPPDIGQGVNSALEDVVVLHQVLAENGDDLARSLPHYEAVRSPDGAAVVRLAQMAAPWQYNQNRLRGRLWAIAFVLRWG